MHLTRAHKDILIALDDWTPGHFLARRVGRQFHPNVSDDLRELLKNGYVLRDQPNTTISKHSAWRRSEKADRELRIHVPHSTASFEHQVLDNMDTLSLQFGVDEDKEFELRYWPDMLKAGLVENKELLERIREGKNPHELTLNGRKHFYDNNNKGPLWLLHNDAQTFIFKEIDRDTEQGRSTEHSEKPTNRRQTWTHKIRAMREFAKTRVWKNWYGTTAHFQAITTVNDTAKRLILEIIKEEIGACAYIGVRAWRDWGNHKTEDKGGERRYPPADGWSFVTPFERVGYEPYALNKFHLIKR